MKYGEVCSGITAPTVAWHDLGLEPVFFSEIDQFPSAVLAHRWPEVPNLGDFTTIGPDHEIDLLVGGTPCQSFSLSGLRLGLSDARGNLALEFVRLAQRLRPRWIVWENVPGVLSSNGGRDLGSILGALVELGYGWAYRVLDAQFLGVPQRRRRVFLVAYLGDWRPPGAVLFESESVSRNFATREQERNQTSSHVPTSPGICWEPETITGRVAHTLTATGFDASEDGSGRGPPLVFGRNNTSGPVSTWATLTAKGGSGTRFDFMTDTFVVEPPRAFHATQDPIHGPISPALSANCTIGVQTGFVVRRTTPLEWERLQGFPDQYTQIPFKNKAAKDGPRYKALGNSMAVPVMRWLGKRIKYVDSKLHS